jgi:HAD superfamily hydrolase (TIGR01458 family)
MIRGVLLDVAGVLYDGDAAVPGSARAVARLREAGLPIRCVTNSTRNPRRVLLDRLDRLGFDIAPEEVFTPAIAARDLLLKRDRGAHLLVHPDLAEDFEDVPRKGDAMTVVVGDAADHFTYDNMNAAFRALDRGADLMALAMNRSFNDTDGALSIDAGAFVTALEYASGKTAEVVGKPAPAFFAAALDSMDVPPEHAVMVGDDAESDVAGALRAGLDQAVLVQTGKYRPGAESAHDPAPSHVAETLSDAVDRILG